MASVFRRHTGTESTRPKPAPISRRSRLAVESLEDRTVPTTFIVTTLQDTINNTDNLLSLREAVILANAQTDVDTITFQSGLNGTLQLTLPVAQFGGALTLSNPVTITGPGATSLNIQQTIGGQNVFTVNDGVAATASSFTLSGLTISGASGAGVGVSNNLDNLTLTNVEITGNNGGAGAGINNVTTTAGRLIVRNSSISGNTSTGAGGGLSINGVAQIENTTISSNTATGGGGIDIANNSNVIIRNSTIAFNTVTAFNGGGIQINGAGAIVTLSSVAVTQNTGNDIKGSVSATSNNNFISSPVNLGGTISNGTNGNQIATQVDPRLGPLAYNSGGTTRTHNIGQSSPLIDTGSNTAGLFTDQNGTNRFLGLGADIGALETVPSTGGSGSSGGSSSTSTSTSGLTASFSAVVQQIVFFALSQPPGLVKVVGILDFNGDGVLDVVLQFGRGRNQSIVIFSGTNGAALFLFPVGLSRPA